jgi:DNA-binding transcriptional ArsR family regulator
VLAYVTKWSHNGAVDEVFKALADDGRRALLDALRVEDGQTLTQLCDVLPDMTRFGVMKHLRILEDAHLVVTERDGRSKLHHLNPVPIREIHDRWISRYAEPHVIAMLQLRDRAEGA